MTGISASHGSDSEPIPEKVIKPWKLPPQKTYVFKNCNIIDPADGVVRPNATVKLAGGTIQSVRDRQSQSQTSDEQDCSDETDGTIVVDLAGRYLCPGLIDCHVHLSSVPGEATLAGTMQSASSDPAVSLVRQPFVCGQVLRRGFTTVRDCGGATLALKEAIADDVFPGPRLFIAGRALSQTGGHGDTRSAHDRGPPSGSCCGAGGLAVVCDGVPDCTRAAREQLRTGADFIKVMVGGGVASPTDALESTQFTAAEVAAIVEVARGHGVAVTAHAYTPRAIRHAVDAGATGIEHGNLLDGATAAHMAARGVRLTPTLVAYEAMAASSGGGFLPPESRRKNDAVLTHGLRSLKIAAAAGVEMCYGSDLLGPLAAEQSCEFAIRRQVLSSLEVLRSATVNAARLLGQEEFLGRVAEGFAADVLILRENPLEDVGILADPESHVLAVIKNGRVYESR
ncbi:hypothetical protein SLS62_005689 [Diatrype stigma]|uniref:Amidohydrolase-related domain-containing protein n=1 Tax=Diatrype stigma TaxID=117547 RepID=A0AAN9UR41_9PEZI